MQAEIATLIDRKDIPEDARITLEKFRTSYINRIKEIKKIKQQLKELIEESPAGILEVDITKRKFISVNNIVCERTGYTKEELLSFDPFDLLEEESKDYFIKRQMSLLSGEDITPRHANFKIRKKNGTLFWISARTKFTLDNQGNAEKATMVLADITDQKKAEMALKESEEKYRTLFESIPDLMALMDLNGYLIDCNNRVSEFIGYPKEELIGKHFIELNILTEKDKRKYDEQFSELPSKSDIKPIDLELNDSLGVKHNFEIVPTLLMKNNRIEAIQIIGHDTTKHRQIERALRESEQRYRRLSEAAFEGLIIHDQGVIIEANEMYTNLLGYELSEILGSNGLEHAAPKSRELILKNILSGSEEPYEALALRKDGTTFPVEIKAKLAKYEGKTVRITAFRDLTSQKKAEEALRESEEKYSNLFHYSNDAIFLHDLKGNILDVNQKVLELFGYTKIDIFSLKIADLHPPVMLEASKKAFETIIQKGFVNFEIDFMKKEGKTFSAEVSSSLFKIGSQKVIQSIVRDITERKRAEIALQEAKEKYQMLIEKMEEGVVLEDVEGFFTFTNPQTVTLLGYTEEELLNKHWSNFIVPDYLEMVRNETSKRSEGISSRYETVALGKDGQHIPLIISATPLHSKEGDFEGVLSVFTDITKIKEVEQRLWESEKRIHQIKLEEERYHAMSSHFLNNDLQKILFALDLLLHKYNTSYELDHEIIKQLRKIVHQSSRKIELVSKIFAVLQSELPYKAEKLNILELINETVEKFTSLSHLKVIEVNESTLSSIRLEGDNYLYDAFYELLFFILNSNYSDLDTKKSKLLILIEASLLPSNFCISIRDNYSQPIPQLISTQLTSPITEKWESRGHYLPIALSSVIMKRYDGTLKIIPLDPKGNEFQLLFPVKSVHHPLNPLS